MTAIVADRAACSVIVHRCFRDRFAPPSRTVVRLSRHDRRARRASDRPREPARRSTARRWLWVARPRRLPSSRSCCSGSSRRSSSSTTGSTRRSRPRRTVDRLDRRRIRRGDRLRRDARRPPNPSSVARASSCRSTTARAASPGCSSWPTDAASCASRDSTPTTGPTCTSTSAPTPPTATRAPSTTTSSTSAGSRATKATRTTTCPPAPTSTGYATVVIWCDRFDSAFGAADLMST